MNVGILGYGKMGRAIGSLLTENGIKFTTADTVDFLADNLTLIFLTVHTQALRNALGNNHSACRNSLLINCAKGIEEGTAKLPYQIVEEVLGNVQYASIIGPSFAQEITDKHHTCVNLATRSNAHADMVSRAVCTPYFRIEPTQYIECLELAGALKNIYAIVCGFSDGLGYGMNTHVVLITLALREYSKVAKYLNIHCDDLIKPGILGDLILTCSSTQSRNYKFGQHATSMSSSEAFNLSDGVVEGCATSNALQIMVSDLAARFPLASLGHCISTKGVGAKNDFNTFISSVW
jgi:glycerol-3-phosphate dehydrogenase (NAD(P)+)